MKNTIIILAATFLFIGCANQDNQTNANGTSTTSNTILNYSGLSADDQARLSPSEALSLLKDGNQRFIMEPTTARSHAQDQRQNTAQQHPFATVLSCFDSRIPVEDIFSKGIGDLLVLRVAGNIVNTDILGSMEYGATDLGSKLIVVLGHKNCTSVRKAIEDDQTGNVASLSMKIKPALTSAKRIFGPKKVNNPEYYNEVIKSNVLNSMTQITQNSAILNQLVKEGKVNIVGAIYDMESGTVEYL